MRVQVVTMSENEYKGIPKLTAVTYSVWKRAMTMALQSEGCLEIVEYQEDEPEPPVPLSVGATPEDQRDYARATREYKEEWRSYRNRYGKAGWLINQSLTPESEIHVKDTTDPAEMWDLLKEKMDSKDNAGLQRSIRKTFHEAAHDGKETIDEYIRKLKECQRALEGTKHSIKDDEIMSKILVTLPATWDTKVSAIEDDESLTLDKLERVLRNFQTKLSNRKASNVALAARGRASNRGRGRGARGTDRRVSDGRVVKPDIECWHCLQKGHVQATCPLKAEKEKREKERKAARDGAAGDKANAVKKEGEDVSSTVEEVEMSFMVKHYSTKAQSEWILDTGATGHMCADPESFESLKRLQKPKKITMANGSEEDAYGEGTVIINPSITLEGVLYVPRLAVNLCSMRKLDLDGYTAIIGDGKIAIYKNKMLVAKGIGKDLYTMNTIEERAYTASTARSEPLALWHRRLGHLNTASVKALQSMAEGVVLKPGDQEHHKICLPCIEGKQHRIYNRHTPSTRMTRRLEMVHSDTCGPFRTPSKAGARVFVLFIDDLTRMVWCSFMKSKADTAEAFTIFKAMAEKHSGERIRRFRCDNGKAEYDNAVFQKILKHEGIM